MWSRLFSLNNRGFTLVELLLSIAIAGLIFGVAAETLMHQADTYSFITSRKTTIADVRHTVERMRHELMRVGEAEISNISSTSINFTDEDGFATSYQLGTDGDALAVYRGNDKILPNVESFTIEYQDGFGDVLEPIEDSLEDLARIKITINTEPVSDEGSVSVSTTIIPREFIGYTNFQ